MFNMEIQINRRMLIYKAWYFFGISAISITPFLSIYFKQLGMSPVRIGTATFVKYMAAALFTPLAGMIADKFRCAKLVVITMGVLWIGSCMLMGVFVPTPQRNQCSVLHQITNNTGCAIRVNISVDDEDNSHGRKSWTDLDDHTQDKSSQGQSSSVHACESYFTPTSDMLADRTWLYSSESLTIVFWWVLLTNSLFEMTFEPLQSIADAESVNTLEEMGLDIADYGKQRAFGSLGWGVLPIIFGVWITYTRSSTTLCNFITMPQSDYRPMFYMFLLSAVATLVTMGFFSYKYEDKPKDKSGFNEQFIKPLSTLPCISALFVLTFTGICDGTVIGYVYWHIDNIGGTELLMGLASACHSVSEVFLGFGTGAAIRKFGHFPLISVGLLTYMFRFVYYAYVTQPWWLLASELLNSLTFILTWNTTLSYLSLTIPVNYRTSLASLLNALVNGLGTAIGYLLGGFLIEIYGTVVTFKIYAGLCGIVAIVFIGVALATTNHWKTDNNTADFDYVAYDKCQPLPIKYEKVCLQLETVKE